MANGYYYAAFSEVKMQCYEPPSGARVQGSVSYTYDDVAATNDTVVTGNKPTVLKSLLGSGTDMNADFPSAAASASASAQSSEVATVPGLTGAGPGTNGQRGDNQPGENSSQSDSADSTATDSSTSAATDFVQGGGSNGSGSGAAIQRPENVLQGSLLAVVVAVIGLLAM